ncbi:hypothetical protein [Microbacterium halophytorum]|uniref:hypothetical protein n=1 Tax=Microbacterium halophytorum TaxID=2067568 RepID=UPI000CFD681C|nr:hypothetical protein [Microbacterium halophytorum]
MLPAPAGPAPITVTVAPPILAAFAALLLTALVLAPAVVPALAALPLPACSLVPSALGVLPTAAIAPVHEPSLTSPR